MRRVPIVTVALLAALLAAACGGEATDLPVLEVARQDREFSVLAEGEIVLPAWVQGVVRQGGLLVCQEIRPGPGENMYIMPPPGKLLGRFDGNAGASAASTVTHNADLHRHVFSGPALRRLKKRRKAPGTPAAICLNRE